MKLPLRPLVLALLALPLAFRPAVATTYKMMTDTALADQAAAVVNVKVVGVDPAPLDGQPATDYLVEVSRVLKGDVPGSTLVVRVPGGVNALGVGLKIWGAPRFAEGEEAILFLRPTQDGTYRILQLMLGAFHRRIVDGRAVAVRDLSEAHEIGPKGIVEGGGDGELRDFDRFSDWLADRAQGAPNTNGYRLGKTKGQLGSIADGFTYLTPADGNTIRWFRFDRGQGVEWRVHSDGQPGLGLAATIDAFKTSIQAWNAEPTTNINYSYVGTTEAGGGLSTPDGVNGIIFDDPFRGTSDEIEGAFSCLDGGIIAVGGPWFFSGTRPYRGQRYHEAGEGDIITNDGTECFFHDNPMVAREVFAHELGHTLGLGHSRLRDALMFASAHNDGRGAQLTDDDREAVRQIYAGGGGGPGSKLAAPVKVTGRATAQTEVTLTWRDKAVGEESYLIEAKRKGKAFEEVLEVEADSTSAVVTDLLPGTTYTFRIRAAGGGGFSPYGKVVVVTTPR